MVQYGVLYMVLYGPYNMVQYICRVHGGKLPENESLHEGKKITRKNPRLRVTKLH